MREREHAATVSIKRQLGCYQATIWTSSWRWDTHTELTPSGKVTSLTLPFQLLLSLAVVVASVSAAPRYLVIPIEDVDLSNLAGQSIPVYRMPGLARQARQLEEDSEPSASNPYAAPHAPAPVGGPDHVDYGAYTGGYGAFGWYTDHPVLLGPGD